MQLRKPIFILSFIGCLFLTSSAVALQSGDFTYIVSDDNATVTITGYTGSGGAVEIPGTIVSKPVITIENKAFSEKTSITSVTIPDSVTSIGYDAFWFCTGLTSMTIPDSVTAIGARAFYECTGLTSLIIGSGVTSMGDEAFCHCTGLTSVTIGTGVTSIGVGAFNGCRGLTAVTIPSSVTNIGQQAFCFCTGLTSVSIPASVTSIGVGPFSACTGLISIDVDPNNPNYSSQDGILYNKALITLIQYPAGKSGAFSIPSSVTSIDFGVFSFCTGLTSVTIPNSVKSIGAAVFQSCTGLNSVNIPSSVTWIGEWAFTDCTSLAAAYFFGNAPEMGHAVGPLGEDSIFYNCANGFTIYYLAGASGFTNPWYGYPTEKFFERKNCPSENVLGVGNPNLTYLRSFRDNILAQSAIGRKVIQIYYNNADSINAALERSPALRAAARKVLEVIAPMVGGKE